LLDCNVQVHFPVQNQQFSFADLYKCAHFRWLAESLVHSYRFRYNRQSVELTVQLRKNKYFSQVNQCEEPKSF